VFKLALVPITIFSEDAVKARIGDFRREFAELRPALTVLAAGAKQQFEAIGKKDEYSKAWFGAQRKLDAAKARMNYADSAACIFWNLPEPIAETKTDADGKFTVKLPRMSTVEEIKMAAATLTPAERLALARLAQRDAEDGKTEQAERQGWHAEFVRLVQQTRAAVGPVTWTRDQLHER
jgi:hypothetical protein